MTPHFSSRYQLIIFSDNYYLWSGLQHCIPSMVDPRLPISWLKETSSKCLFQLRDQILKDNSGKKWLVMTGHHQIRDIQQILPSDKVCILRDNLSLKQLANQLQRPEFRHVSQKEVPLSRTEIQVCLLIIKGFSTAKIASMMNKSIKTIYTHRRNAMGKLQCHTLAELHRNMHLMESRSLYQ